MPSSEPTLLAFDTAAAHCAAALLCGGRTLVRVEPMDRGQAERLFPMLSEVLAEAGIGWHHLDGIGVGTGPGNFTGIRIAVSAARGLALGLGIPAVGVDAFEALREGHDGPCACAVDARRNQVFLQGFDNPSISEPALFDATALPAFDGPLIGAHGQPPAMPVAEAIARIAARRYEAQPPRPAPLYLRPADAAPARDAAPVLLP